MADWKEIVHDQYFKEHKMIDQIARECGKSRRTVSAYLNSLPEYQEEKDRRKAENADRRKSYKRNWDRKNRVPQHMLVTGDTLRREHELAVMELSHERYH
ncbi:MAG: hypothetical protein IJ079_03845 [Lachnospiraceae bacterium]|nr:hypothetical protein [Lachnospiraceae bacterium]MBR1567541.1 hypothetical protein [Lachnospiraceae bacterium]MBR1568697.1 hypothetical protein [Lachnospiraceae bacterium]